MKIMQWRKIGFGLVAVSAAAGAYAALRFGNRFLDAFEDTAHDAAPEGEYIQTADGWRIHYTVTGDGPPVVLIHGFLDSLQSWRRNIPTLAQTHRVYAIDVLGFGASQRVRDHIYTMKQQAAILQEFFQAHNIANADVIGHSMGGALALQFAYDFPSSVHKVVLIAPATYLYPILPGLKRVPRGITRGVLGIYEKMQGERHNPLHFAYGDPERITADALAFRNQMLRVRGQHDALISMTKSNRESDVPRALPQMNVPALIIWGKKDRVLPGWHAHRHIRDLPNARLEWIANAGHLPHEEEPESVNQLITNFLNPNASP